jgi:hypothetical protein
LITDVGSSENYKQYQAAPSKQHPARLHQSREPVLCLQPCLLS